MCGFRAQGTGGHGGVRRAGAAPEQTMRSRGAARPALAVRRTALPPGGVERFGLALWQQNVEKARVSRDNFKIIAGIARD